MGKKIRPLIILFSVTFLIILGFLILFSKRVIIYDEVFKPDSINIIKGGNVTWVNKGDLPHWPASDPHPIHTNYPSKEKGCIGSSLDACRGLNTGEAYSFSFDKVGSWGIHDHLFHSHTMTVNVYNNYFELLIAKVKQVINGFKNNFKKQVSISVNTDLNQAVKFCGNQDRTQFISCLKTILVESDKFDVKGLISQLDANYRQNDSSTQGGITRCHDIAHAIGQAGVTSIKDPKAVLSQCTDLCTSGCFHGAIEQSVLEQSADAFLSKVNSLCSQPACFHGLGHGLASIAGYDLGKSLQLCDRLDNYDAKRNCGFGVFMELYEPSSFNPTPLKPPSDLLGLCFSLTGVYQEVCFRNIGTYQYARTNQDIKKAFALCHMEPTANQRECRVALGQVIYFNRQGEAKSIIDVCSIGMSDEYKDCIDGSIMASVSSDPLVRHGFELCSQIDNPQKIGCYQFLGSHIQAVYGVETRNNLCNQLAGNMLIYNECTKPTN